MRVLRDKILGLRMKVRKITPATAGNNYLASNFRIVLDHQHPPPALSRGYRAKETGRPAADNNRVIDQRLPAGTPKKACSEFVKPRYLSLKMTI